MAPTTACTYDLPDTSLLNRDELQDPDLTENARRVLAERYLKCDENGDPVEEPKDLFKRVAEAIARPEHEKYERTVEETEEIAREFYDMMAEGRWMPNSPTLFNAGREIGQLSACFVLPVEDDMEEIMNTARDAAMIHKSGGGTGFSFSKLRPRGSRVASTDGVATGPVSFMEMYDSITEKIKQGGNRRGANMGILRCDHPDIREFIECKSEEGRITNFNISVAATDEFMEAAKNGEEYDLVAPHTDEVVGTENAREILDLIVENAADMSEPGLFFIDEANRHNPLPHIGLYRASNPCGEQPLYDEGDVCNLGHINLAEFVEDAGDDPVDRIDEEGLRQQAYLGMRFLDNVIDENNYPLEKTREMSDRIRRVGQGVMGLADLLTELDVPYDSEQGQRISEYVASVFEEACHDASEELAKERGVFPEWEESIWGPDESCARDEDGNRVREYRPMRNCNTNTVAPTGTTSIIAGCSSGIEPLFAIAFTRNQAGMTMIDVNDQFESRAKREGWYSEELMERVNKSGTADVEGVPEHVKEVFKTAHEIAPADHIEMQAVWQRHIDSGISKTINLPAEIDLEGVRQAYMMAYETGCKGITVYRDGSREGQALQMGDDEPQEEQEHESSRTHRKRERPDTLPGYTKRIETPLGTLYATINEDERGPFEVFVQVGKAGGSANADSEAIGRVISLALRRSVDPDETLAAVAEELQGISSDRTVGFGENKVRSMPDGLGQVLEQHLTDVRGVDSVEVPENGNGTQPVRQCPDCGSSMAVQEGCEKCVVCGHSECG